MIRIAFAALMALVLFPLPALAETSVVQLTPILEPVITALFTLLAAVATWFIRKAIKAFETKVDIDFDEQTKKRIEDALLWGVDFGKSKAIQLAKDTSVDVRSVVVAEAVRYVTKSVPDSLGYFGIDQYRLRDMVEARIGIDLDQDGDIAGEPA
ncbi:inadl protein [Roseibium alexandrii]|uniref:inadl protein n=1 Tax=Roseibium alexandrii TaxID=388408 RepID=UPI003752F1B6